MKICIPVKTGSLALLTGLTLGLAGCSTSFFADNSNLCVGDNGVYQRCSATSGNSYAGQYDVNHIGNQHVLVHQLLPEYVEQLAMQLVANMHIADGQKSVAITSFVSFDSDLRQGDVFGNQLSELFYNELQLLGVNLVDYNVSQYIESTQQGAFAMSRDYNMQDDWPFDYVLTGTWLKTKKGIVVNARIVGVNNKQVLATANRLIPSFIVSAE